MSTKQSIPVRITHMETGEVHSFSSLTKAATFVGCNQSNFRLAMLKKGSFRKWKIEEEDRNLFPEVIAKPKKEPFQFTESHLANIEFELAIMKRNLPDGYMNNTKQLEKFVELKSKVEEVEQKRRVKINQQMKAKKKQVKLCDEMEAAFKALEEEVDQEDVDDDEEVAGLKYSYKGRLMQMTQDPICRVDQKNNLLRMYERPEQLEDDGYQVKLVFSAMHVKSLTNHYQGSWWITKSSYDAYWRARRKQEELAKIRPTKMSEINRNPLKGYVRF